jgi:UDPglucose 6-dehydrogenase
MKLSVIGQDTLAEATYQCCQRHFETYRIPCHGAEIWWITYDTPIVGPEEKPDATWVIDRIRELLVDAEPGPLILVSSQMPVGTTAALEKEFPDFAFAHSPENIRVATAISDFENQARVVVGRRTERHDELLKELFAPFTKNLILCDPESAECVKHFLNCMLALTICYANEMAKVARSVGADPDVITKAIRLDQRFSPKTPIKAGDPYGGGHLARDVYTVNRIAVEKSIHLPVISRIHESNSQA